MKAVPPLQLLCAGALQGLVKALQARFLAATGATLQGRYGAVGAMKEALLAGVPCDVLVVTQALVEGLVADGHLRAGSAAALGTVRTGLCVRSGEARPDVSTPEGLQAALRAADGIYFPDPARATAGIHFVKVLRELGIHDELAARFRTAPSGAVAMRALADKPAPRLLGCTQITEILYTEGVDLIGALPPGFELATVYTAAVSTQAAAPDLAARLIALLTGPESQALRAAGGFDT